MKNIWVWISGFVAAVMVMLMVGVWWVVKQNPLQPVPPRVMIARYTTTPITIDGVLNEPAWQEAHVYKMSLSKKASAGGRPLHEGGVVKLTWNQRFLYVGAQWTDSDIVAEGNADQFVHYKLGDVLELFLKPDDKPWYWELYATPRSNKSWFFLPQREGSLEAGSAETLSEFIVKAQCHGTVNDGTDKDLFWTVEMAVPVKALTTRGELFGPESQWRILVGRYNYSRDLPVPWLECSMVPPLRSHNFHLLEGYAQLKLEP